MASGTDRRTIEFDVAVAAEETTTTEGGGGVKVLAFMEAGAGIEIESKKSTVSRITFGVDVSIITKQEQAIQERQFEQNSQQDLDNWR